MYELEIKDIKSITIRDLFTHRAHHDIINWMRETNIDIRYKINVYDRILEPRTEIFEEGNYIDFEMHIIRIIISVFLVFDNEEDRNLFKLTWG